MRFTIGRDLGFVLAKGIVCSLATVLILMPALILRFQDRIRKTQHRSFVPSMDGFARKLFREMCIRDRVSGGLLGLSVLAGSRLGALGAVAQIAGAVLLILLGAGKLAGSWLRSLAARLAEQGRCV